jgi:hypothetical protein
VKSNLKFYFDSDTFAVFGFDLIPKKNLSRFQKMILDCHSKYVVNF